MSHQIIFHYGVIQTLVVFVDHRNPAPDEKRLLITLEIRWLSKYFFSFDFFFRKKTTLKVQIEKRRVSPAPDAKFALQTESINPNLEESDGK